MRIHIIGINYWPEVTGIAVFSTGRAEHLAAAGHHVTMCTAVPYYPQWRVPEEYRGLKFTREARAGVTILRCPLYVPSAVKPIRRVLHEASFIASAFLRSLFCRRPDVLFVVSPPLGLAIAAVILSWLWRVPYVFHVADLQPDTALDLGMVGPGRVARLLYAVERLAYRRAAIVSTLTDAMRARIIAKGIPGQKVVLFADWADPRLFALASGQSDPIRRELDLGDAFLVLHAGNMGVKQGLDVVLDAAQQTRFDPGILYVLVGDGAMRPHLERRAHRLGLDNVRIVPLLDHERFLRLLAAADVCLVTQQRTVADVVFPSKVLTLLAAGKPVIASVTGGSAVANVIAGAGAGTVVPAEAGDALVTAIEALRRDTSLRAGMGAAGRAYASRHWERTATLRFLTDTVERVADASATDVPVPTPAKSGPRK
jgi:putative colanic acid biosynthesis glycosyltransferase WcaI